MRWSPHISLCSAMNYLGDPTTRPPRTGFCRSRLAAVVARSSSSWTIFRRRFRALACRSLRATSPASISRCHWPRPYHAGWPGMEAVGQGIGTDEEALYTSRISCQCISRFQQGASGSRRGSETTGIERPSRRAETCNDDKSHFPLQSRDGLAAAVEDLHNSDILAKRFE